MAVGVTGYLQLGEFNHGGAPTDLTDIDANPVAIENKAFGGGFQIEGEFGFYPGNQNRLEILIRPALGYTWQGRAYPTDVYAPPECDKYAEGDNVNGVLNGGSASTCGETGDPVDASTAHYDRVNIDVKIAPRLWIIAEKFDVTAAFGYRGQPYTRAQLLAKGAYGMVDLTVRHSFVYGGELGLIAKQDVFGAKGDLRLSLCYEGSSGNSFMEDTGTVDPDDSIHDTTEHAIKLGVGLVEF